MRLLLSVFFFAGYFPLVALAEQDEVTLFLERHWAQPLAPQGTPPATFTHLESSLKPEDCGRCHPQQLADWQRSHHHGAMSPGVFGQLLAMAREEQQACLRCHAPLAEQADSLLAAVSGTTHSLTLLASHADGLTCSGCHVRRHQRFGPPSGKSVNDRRELPHQGWTVAAAFADSRFCAICHQFAKDGTAVNGKLLENTYAEWLQSRYAKEGKTCQTCHMPNRRHLWRGIHDPVMVREGVTLTVEHPTARPGEASLRLVLHNTAVGHYFPTYVTPRVVMEVWQQESGGKIFAQTREQRIIAREVTLDLTHEEFDTRLAPDSVAVLSYRHLLHDQAAKVGWQVIVEPDAFYRRFYQALLQEETITQGKFLLRRALHRTKSSSYILFSGEYPIHGDRFLPSSQ